MLMLKEEPPARTEQAAPQHPCCERKEAPQLDAATCVSLRDAVFTVFLHSSFDPQNFLHVFCCFPHIVAFAELNLL